METSVVPCATGHSSQTTESHRTCSHRISTRPSHPRILLPLHKPARQHTIPDPEPDLIMNHTAPPHPARLGVPEIAAHHIRARHRPGPLLALRAPRSLAAALDAQLVAAEAADAAARAVLLVAQAVQLVQDLQVHVAQLLVLAVGASKGV